MDTHRNDQADWRKTISKYTKPAPFKIWWQIANSFIPYFGLWVLMVYSLDYSYWITLGLSIVAAGFLTRIFIIFHDCGHGSYFRSSLVSRIVGTVAGLLVFTPYHRWTYQHMVHHQTVGNLDKRGEGDVMTLTVDEYKSRSPIKQLMYRLYRNPIVLFLIVPFFLFTVLFRFPNKNYSRRINHYTHLTTLGLIAMVTIVSLLLGFKTYVLVQIPVLFFGTAFGVWLFYLQHQFKDVVWERTENWDYKRIAMEGSSYLKFPGILQWFTGNIGFHHIHHLGPRIPNYNLEKCNSENPAFQKEPMKFNESFLSMHFRLWDEEKHKLVGFREALG